MKKILLSSFVLFGLNQVSLAETLLYVNQGSAKSCEVKTFSLPEKKEQILFSDSTCPELLTWDFHNNRFLYIADQEIKLKIGEQVKALALPPFLKKLQLKNDPHEDDRWNVDLWIDQQTKRPRIVFLVNVEKTDIKISNKRNRQSITITFDGKQYTRLHQDGSWRMALMYEWHDNAWKRLAIAPTTVGPDFAPGLDALNAYVHRKTLGTNVGVTVNQTTCMYNTSLLKCNEQKSKKISQATLQKLFSKPLNESDGYGVLTGFKQGKVVFATSLLETLQVTEPAYFCEDNACKKTKKINGLDNYIGLAKIGEWLVVMEAYTNQNPRLYQFNQSDPVWSAPKGKLIGWKP